ncbi:LysR substrate-binding domain-containing protein [Breoghania sp.]|uniref:LysR substrate-binding domain-containing protein n=1 Tax=Breoghania sp. TaxID=2065378 RepID=UPI002632C5E9|nr:LysR substrate-binding domain-containing protein [Breoghania sp.]MDJ0929820.1 LysR substrate-binding domain-containing protein [Breoghania sp.]
MAGEGEMGRIVLGVSATATASGIVAHLVRSYRLRRPLVSIQIVETDPVTQSRALLEGGIDIALGPP